MKQEIDSNVIMFAIGCVTIMQIFAMYNGHNGLILAGAIAFVAAAAGVVYPTPKILLKK